MGCLLSLYEAIVLSVLGSGEGLAESKRGRPVLAVIALVFWGGILAFVLTELL